MNYNNTLTKDKQDILTELYEMPNWVLWKLELNETGHLDKVPYTIYNRRASTTNPKTWLNYEDLIYFYNKDQATDNPKYDGIGFVFSNKDNYVFIDLDNCITEDTNSKQTILDTYESLGAIAEYSQSGRGIHIITKSNIREFVNNKPMGVEIYHEKRFVALTQNWIYITGLEYTTKYTESLIKQYSTRKDKTKLNITSNLNKDDIYRHKFEIPYKVKIANDLITNTYHGHPIEFNDKIYQTRSELEGWIIMQFIVLGYSFEECYGYFEKHNQGTFREMGDKRRNYLAGYWKNGLKLFNSGRIRKEIKPILQNFEQIKIDVPRNKNLYLVLKSLLLLAHQFDSWTINASLNDLWIISGVQSKTGVRTSIKQLDKLNIIGIIKTDRTNKITINKDFLHSEHIHTGVPMGNNMYVSSVQKNYIFQKLGLSTWDIYTTLIQEPKTVKDMIKSVNKNSSTVYRSLNRLIEWDIVIKSGKLYSINENLDWDKLIEDFNVELEFHATRETVEQERNEQRQRIKEWKFQNRAG